MQIESGKRRDFWGYLNALRYLEQAFRAVGLKVDISLNLFKNGQKSICIENDYDRHYVRLKDLSPEQALKEAACFLISGHYSVFCRYQETKKEKING